MPDKFVSQQKHDADIDQLTLAIQDTRDRIEDYKQTTNQQIAFWGIAIAGIAVIFACIQVGLAIIFYYLK
ncbi:MAG: hypothetical protein IJF90_10020 [Synergistaceae bacterium]|nr:hypothetical protein [Synergistaceae bacterium]